MRPLLLVMSGTGPARIMLVKLVTRQRNSSLCREDALFAVLGDQNRGAWEQAAHIQCERSVAANLIPASTLCDGAKTGRCPGVCLVEQLQDQIANGFGLCNGNEIKSPPVGQAHAKVAEELIRRGAVLL